MTGIKNSPGHFVCQILFTTFTVLVKMHSTSPSVIAFCPVYLGICHIYGKTPRGILPVNSTCLLIMRISMSNSDNVDCFIIQRQRCHLLSLQLRCRLWMRHLSCHLPVLHLLLLLVHLHSLQQLLLHFHLHQE